ncbi:hypothetical protein [Brevibacillus sp. HD3.3A]|nr:hypothetical protein [Brevibacillus sp. HD3.3A]UED70732.1 hypothetical protein HP435_08875 [Brevibacillus sp. HD3.3A]
MLKIVYKHDDGKVCTKLVLAHENKLPIFRWVRNSFEIIEVKRHETW